MKYFIHWAADVKSSINKKFINKAMILAVMNAIYAIAEIETWKIQSWIFQASISAVA